MNGNYPSWSEFIMSADSTVFRQSDLISTAKWEHTHVYREIWAPINGYWGLMMSVIYNDHPLILLGLYREKSKGDFIDRDVYIMNLLKPALEIKLYSLLEDQPCFSHPGLLQRSIRLRLNTDSQGVKPKSHGSFAAIKLIRKYVIHFLLPLQH